MPLFYAWIGQLQMEKLFQVSKNKKDMKPFHIDRELECPILFNNVLSCLRTSYPVLERSNTV